MLSMESMIAISSRRGGGGRQTPPSRFPRAGRDDVGITLNDSKSNSRKAFT